MSDGVRTMHLLLVEDDEAHANLVQVLVNSVNVNCSVAHVTDGQHAIDYLHGRGRFADADRPDVILLDLKLSGMNGHEFLEIIKNDPDYCMIPVIVLTTSNNAQDRRRAYELHANSFITKPLDFERIRLMVHNLMQYWGMWNQPPNRNHDDDAPSRPQPADLVSKAP